MWETLTSHITEFNRPRHFRDVMMRAIFYRFMRDALDFVAPLAAIGRCAELSFLLRYLQKIPYRPESNDPASS